MSKLCNVFKFFGAGSNDYNAADDDGLGNDKDFLTNITRVERSRVLLHTIETPHLLSIRGNNKRFLRQKKMMATRSATLLTATVRFESTNLPNGKPAPSNQNPPARPLLSLTKPSWIVRTESNVRLDMRNKPDPPCVVCRGTGRVDCPHCRGKGRTNEVDLVMLSKGEWPKCKACGGSGLSYCSRCLGTGEYRYLMGFHFMKRNQDEEAQDRNQVDIDKQTRSAADLFLSDDGSSVDIST